MKEFFYRVREGDSLIKICRRYSAPPELVIRENNLGRELEEGDIVFVAGAGTACYRAKADDDYARLARRFNVDEEELRLKNGADYSFYGLPMVL